MTASRQDLERWVEAGLIHPEQAEAIEVHEATRSDDRSGPPREPRRAARPPRRGLAAEAVGYVGAALAVGAVGLLVADTWDGLRHGGRLALVALLAVVLAGAAVATSRQQRAPLQRLTSVLFTGVVATVAWFVALVAAVDLGARGAQVAVFSAAAALLLAAPLYAWRRRPLPQATVLVPVVALSVALLSSMDLPPPARWFGLVLWAIGVAWALAGHGGWLPPAPLAGALGGVVALLGVQVGSFEGGRAGILTLGVVSAGLAVAVAVRNDTPHHLAVGAIGLFLLVPQLVFELFGDAIGAPATLLVIGLLLVLLAVGIGRVRREVAPGGAEEVAR